jgi:hypothetical protein
VTIGEPGDPAPVDRDWTYVVTVSNHGPERLENARTVNLPPGEARLIAAHPSQGRCDLGSVATCELGALAAGSEASVIVTVRPNRDGDHVFTATATASAPDGAGREASGIATTRGVRHTPSLIVHRPVSATIFRPARNNTIQWTLRGAGGPVKVELSRDDGESWITLSEGAPDTGFYDWTASGPSTTRARIRVSSVNQPELTQTSPPFTIATQ